MKFKKKIKISNKYITENKCFIVAEISGNHDGKISNIKKIISKLDRKKIDAIKLQAYQANTITLNSRKKDFKIQKGNKWSKYNYLYDLYKYAETPFNWMNEIFKFCKKKKIIVFASVFDISSLKILEKLNCPAYKIASPEITDLHLIEETAKTKKPIILSNGLANLKDLYLAISVIKSKQNNKLIVLKCTSSYPAEISEINLKTMFDIKKKFNCLTGFSDHSTGINVAIHAASMGASLIEKHVCLKNVKAVDSFFSIDTKKFNKMARIIRTNEKANGKITYQISKGSKKNLIGRKSLYVVNDIKKNEEFTKENIKAIRPSFGLHPKFYKKIIGKKSKQDVSSGERMEWSLIKK
jgi:N-acetylneuraminate synthase/pseudaminic acid synthase